MEKTKAYLLDKKAAMTREESRKEIENCEERLNFLEAVRPALEKLLENLFSLEEQFTLEDFIKWMAGLVAEFSIEEALKDTSQYGPLAAQDYNAFRKLNDTMLSLKKVMTIFGKKNFSKREFSNLFESLIHDIHYRYQYYAAESVKLLTPFDARETGFRAVFIAGLNEGQFPGGVPLSIADLSEKRKFNRLAHKIILEDEENRSLSEKLDFEVAYSRGEEKIFLSHTPFDESGREILPSSYLLNTIKTANLSVEEWKKQKDRIFEIILSEKVAGIYDLRLLLINEYESFGSKRKDLENKYPFFQNAGRMHQYDKAVLSVTDFYEDKADSVSTAEIASGEKYFGAMDFAGSVPENLRNRETIHQKLKNMVFSSSRLETFGNCRYQFFIRYILSIAEEEYPRQEIEPALKGQFLHSVLKDYMEKTKDSSGQEILADPVEYYRLLDACIEKNFGEFINKEGEKGLFALEKDYYRKILQNFILFDASCLRENKPSEFEYPLDLELKIPEENPLMSVKITGSIDRIDEMERDNGKSFRVLDYKTGSVRHFKTDFLIPFHLFQGFIYAKAFGKKIEEISYVSIESTGNDRQTDVLPFRCRYNRSTRCYDKNISSFDAIWNQKEKEILAVFNFIKDGNFKPYSREEDYPSGVLEFYQDLSKDGQIEAFETDSKCKFCAYTEACLRSEKLIEAW